VLQMAIEGKLVPQLDDEPAVDIEAVEPEEVPFAIPEKWKWVTLESVCKSIVDGDHMPPPKVEKGIPFLVISDISSGYINFKDTRFVPETYYEALSPSRKSERGDVLLAVTGSLGVSVLVNTDKRFTFQRHIALLKTQKELLSPKYAWILFQTTSVCDKLKEVSTGTAQKTVPIKALRKIAIPLPPLAEQLRIVARLNEILPLIEEYGKAHSALKNAEQALPDQLRASLLQEAIQGKLVPQLDDEPAVDIAGEEPDEVPFAIPEKWRWVRLGELIKIISGTSYKKDDVSASGLRIIRGGNIQNNKVVLCDDDVFLPIAFLDQNKTVQKGDVVIVASTGSEKVIGKPGVYDGNEIIQIGAFLRILRPQNIEFYEYLRVIIVSDYYRGHIREVAKGTNIRNIKAEYITDLPIPLPPLAEQRRIVARLEELLPHVDAIAGVR